MFILDMNDPKVLVKATKSGLISNVQLVIQRFKDAGRNPRHEIRTTDGVRRTALHVAAKNKHYDILLLLLQYSDHDTINACSQCCETPLIAVLKSKNWHEPYKSKIAAMVLALLGAGADPNKGDYPAPPLHIALAHEWWEGAKILMDVGASVTKHFESTAYAKFCTDCTNNSPKAGSSIYYEYVYSNRGRPAYFFAVNDLSTFEEVAQRGGLIDGFRDYIREKWPCIPNKLELLKIWAKYDDKEPIHLHPHRKSSLVQLPELYDRERVDGFIDLLHYDIENPSDTNCLVSEFLLQNDKTKTSTLIVAYHLTVYYHKYVEDECDRATIGSTSAMIRKIISERFQDRDTVIEHAMDYLTIEEFGSEDCEVFFESIKKHNIPFLKLGKFHLIRESPLKESLVGKHDDLHFFIHRYFIAPDEYDPLFSILTRCRRRKGLDDLVQKLIVAGMPVTTLSLFFAFWWASFKRTTLKNCLTTLLDNCPPPNECERLSLVKEDLARPVAAMAVLKGAHYKLFILLREGFPAREVEKVLIDMRVYWEIDHHLGMRRADTHLPGLTILESFLPVVSKKLALKYKRHYRPKESPKSLTDLCRISIRQNYGFREVQEELQNLELDLSVPSIIVEYLRYDGDPEHVANQLIAGERI